MESGKENFVSDLHRNRAAALNGSGGPEKSLGPGNQH